MEKSSPYGIKRIIKHYSYRSYPKLSPGIFSIGIIPCNFHACKNILSLYWDSKIKEAVNRPRYGRLYNCKYSQIVGCHNNWMLMIYYYYGIDEEDFEHIN